MGVLPLELLAEVLSYTAPRDILALARTSKYYCATLVANPASKFIWKKARVRYEPTIPEPTPNFTEPAYAALLFDTGTCEVSPVVSSSLVPHLKDVRLLIRCVARRHMQRTHRLRCACASVKALVDPFRAGSHGRKASFVKKMPYRTNETCVQGFECSFYTGDWL